MLMCVTDVGHFSKTAASDMTKAARAKYESRRAGRLSRSTEALPTSAAEASSSDIRSRRTSLQTKLFSSARHPTRSTQQSDAGESSHRESSAGHRRRSKRRPRSVIATDEQSASSDTSRDASSATTDSQSTPSTHTQTAVPADTSSSNRLTEPRHSMTQDACLLYTSDAADE